MQKTEAAIKSETIFLLGTYSTYSFVPPEIKDILV